MTTNHTPTPWRVSPSHDGAFRVVQVAAPVAQITKIGNEANAAHIVRCVNAHDELVAVLRYLVAKVEDGDEVGPALVMARAALAKVTP